MKLTLMIVLLLMGLFVTTNYETYAQGAPGAPCDVCYENGVPKAWTGPYIYEEVYTNYNTTPIQYWDVIYMTRSCIKGGKIELHYKVIGIKSPQIVHNSAWIGIATLMQPIHDILLGVESILSEFDKHSITLAQGQTMKIRLYQARCWMLSECETTQCYDNTQELIYPCSQACCEYVFNVTRTCNSDFIIDPEPPNNLDGSVNCYEQPDPDVCRPNVCTSLRERYCTANYGGCIQYYHSKK